MQPVPAQLPAFQLPVSRSVAPSDESTSVVIEPDPGRQIPAGLDGLDGLDRRRDVVYAFGGAGRPRDLRLDLLLPRGARSAPVVVHVPGGGFVVSPKEAAGPGRAYVARAGFAVASVEYRTVTDGATYDDAVADVHEAIRFLRAHAEEFGFDATRVGVWGESAGGYLAAMVGVTAGRPTLGDGTTAVDAVIDFFGASDLARIAEDLDDTTQRFYRSPDNYLSAFLGFPGRGLHDIPEAVAAADPATYASAGTPPFLLVHGSADTLVSPSQTLRLHTALRAAGGASTRYVVRGGGHGDLPFLGTPASGSMWTTTDVLDIVIEFLQRQLVAAQQDSRV